MPTYQQLPADLAIECVQGDQLDVSLDFSVDLTGYTFEAIVYEPHPTTSGAWGGSGGGLVVGPIAAEFTISAVDIELGQVNLGLAESSTADLDPATAYRWYFRYSAPGGVTLTPLAGSFVVKIP